jgi:hypothetical protein
VAEDQLDVEQVEVVRALVGGGSVEDAGSGPAQVVGSDVAESGRLLGGVARHAEADQVGLGELGGCPRPVWRNSRVSVLR